MQEEILSKILELHEEGMSWQDIARRFPVQAKELHEIEAVIELLEQSKTSISPNANLLHAILNHVPVEDTIQSSGFSRFASMVLKFGAPLAISAAAFVLVLTLTSSPAVPTERVDQLALKNGQDTAAPAATAALMAVPNERRAAAESGATPSTNTSAADKAADQALASSFDDGSSSDAAMQSYFDQSSIDSYDQSANNTTF